MNEFSRSFAFAVICCAAFLASAQGQIAGVIPANEAAGHINEWATLEDGARSIGYAAITNDFGTADAPSL
jgi:hypothetical protein